MKWLWLAISVLAGTFGDLMTARGMAEHREIEDFGARGLARILRHIGTHREVIAGMVFNSLSFFSLMALLSVSEVSFAIPAGASSYVIKAALARWYLGEHLNAKRWLGAVCVAIGIALIAF
ncbi:MAG: EamA family transporter [Acidobacteriaceae bacterium]|nr:EamA family transporter [Acidobacteriaceae bacterium]